MDLASRRKGPNRTLPCFVGNWPTLMKNAPAPLVTTKTASRSVKERNSMLPRFLQPVLIAALALTTVATAQQANVTHAKPNYGKLPLVFEANQGQTDPSVKFLTRGEGYTAFLTSSGLTLSLRSPEAATADHASASAANRTLQLNFLGTRKNSSVSGEEKQSGRVNYFLGSNPALWHTNVPTYGEVR